MNESIYNDSFFKSHTTPGTVWEKGYAPIARALVGTMGKPFSAWDMGCGIGSLMDALFELGCDVKGMEGSVAALPYIPPRLMYRIAFGDILEDHPTPYVDMTICTEVAEHTPPGRADRLVEVIANVKSPHVYFTAASPGQGGVNHVNEQLPHYWMDRFYKCGYELSFPMTSDLRGRLAGSPLTWYTWNSMLFERRRG